MKRKGFITKQDIGLMVILFVAAGLLYAFLKISGEKGTCAAVYENQKEIARYVLSADGSYRIQTDGGVNVLVIQDGKASVTEADCPDGDCIRMGEIDKTGETIVCLPHKLVVQIEE